MIGGGLNQGITAFLKPEPQLRNFIQTNSSFILTNDRDLNAHISSQFKARLLWHTKLRNTMPITRMQEILYLAADVVQQYFFVLVSMGYSHDMENQSNSRIITL